MLNKKDTSMKVATSDRQASLCSKAILNASIILLLTLVGQASATSYVRAQKVYLGSSADGYFADGGGAAASVARASCNGWGQSGCSATYSGESFSGNLWQWKATMTYIITTPNPPNPPIVTSHSTTTGGLITYNCAPGFVPYDLPNGTGLCSGPDPIEPPPPPPLNKNCECTNDASTPVANPTVGNPIIPATGVKEQIEADYSNSTGTLFFTRIYRSNNKRWENNYQSFAASLQTPTPFSQTSPGCVMGTGMMGTSVIPYCYPYASIGTTNDFAIRRAGGKLLYASSSNSYLPSAADVNDRVSPSLDSGGIQNGWNVKNGDTDALEHYDLNGLLLSSTSRNGQKTVFTYSDATTPPALAPSPGLLLTVTDAFGKQLNFTYNSKNLMSTMVDPANGIYLYAYGSNDNLISVTYPDGKIRQYLYNEPANTATANLPFALTGIVDENDVRYATFKYSPGGTALSTAHAGEVGKFTLTYPYSNRQTVVVDPLGATRTYTFLTVLGVVKSSGITQPAPMTGTVSTLLSYDVNGNVASTTDFNGNRTTYTYDLLRNLELTKVEAAGTVNARTTSTAWHTTWRLPVKIAEPKRLTVFTHDASGNVLTRSIQATNDLTGASGFNAALVGTARIWTYTYNQLGQLLTVKGPRTDVNELTTYGYDNQGNLKTITNAAGHITTLSNYDLNGRVGRIIDPNGLITDFTYWPRGWLASRTVGGEHTGYIYDNAGLLKQVTLPDNSTVKYTYDDAHRLTNVADSLGNSITYALDPIGNRIAENINDTNGTLVRKTTRVYNVLNTLKQQTGGAQ